MTVRSIFVLLSPVISGVLLVHLIWPDKEAKSLLFKVCLGIGVGLGINSLLDFLYLLIFNHQAGFLGLQILVLSAFILVTIFKEWPFRYTRGIFNPPDRLQFFILICVTGMTILALAISIIVSLRKPQGAWDSWMIYNRAARFIYRGGDHWADAFSPEMYWFFHTDYPPLVSLNVASGWDALGEETVRIPIVLGGVFLFGSAGLLFAGMNIYKTLGQASLAMMALFGTSAYIEMGSKQVADIPLSFFILATGILLFLYSIHNQHELLILAGLTAGLAAWTKNEGLQFFLVSIIVILFVYRHRLRLFLPRYILGFAFPIALVIYFKTIIAPPNDIVVDFANRINQVFDPNRHIVLLQEFGTNLMALSNWALLAVYLVILGIDITKDFMYPFLACLTMVVLQLIGYYSIFLISPHPLSWHLSALYRLLLQVSPLIIFLYFSVVRTPETIFHNN